MEDINHSLGILSRIVLNYEKEFITNFQRIPLYNDEPKIFAYTAEYRSKYKNKNIASGFSFNKNKALIRVFGESIERFCLDNYKSKSLVVSSIKKLKAPYLDPFQVTPFSPNQLKKRSFRKFKYNNHSRFNWIQGISIAQKKNLLVPAQLVCFNYAYLKGESTILLPISTGTAAGISIQSAVYRGICEIIERDAFMIAYLNKIPSPRLNLDSIHNKIISNILNIFKRYRLTLVVSDVTTDIPIPAFVAIILDKTGFGPAVSVGLKAGFDIEETIIGAIEESVMTRSWIRDKYIYTNPNYKRQNIISSIQDRAHFWFPVETIKYLDFWIHSKSKNIEKIAPNDLNSREDRLNKAVKLLKTKHMDVIYVDITYDKIKRYDFAVVKVIIPQLHPLYLDERYPYLGGNRLYEAPVKMGFFKKPKNEEELNKTPHPFL